MGQGGTVHLGLLVPSCNRVVHHPHLGRQEGESPCCHPHWGCKQTGSAVTSQGKRHSVFLAPLTVTVARWKACLPLWRWEEHRSHPLPAHHVPYRRKLQSDCLQQPDSDQATPEAQGQILALLIPGRHPHTPAVTPNPVGREGTALAGAAAVRGALDTAPAESSGHHRPTCTHKHKNT